MFATALRFVHRIATRWAAHDNSRAAAAIAYYALFTFAPVLVFATALAGWFVTPDDAHELTQDWLDEAIGPAGSQLAYDVFSTANFSRNGTTAMAISGILLLYGASSSVVQLRSALDAVRETTASTTKEAFLRWLCGRLLASALVIGAGVLLVGTMIGTVALHGFVDRLAAWSGLSSPNWHIAGIAASLLSDGIVLTAVYTVLPSSHPPLRRVWIGVLVGMVLFEAGKWIFGIYIARSVVATAYGPSSSIVACIVWIYFSAQIVLLGAEINAVCHDEATIEHA